MIKKIAFAGIAGSGKTTLAKYLADEFGFERISISDRIKKIANYMMFTVEGVDIKDKHVMRPYYKYLGAELHEMNNTILVDYLIKKYSLYADDKKYVIDDVRRVSEAVLLQECGFIIIKLNIDKQTALDRIINKYGDADENMYEHSTETDIPLIDCDYEFNSITDSDIIKNKLELEEIIYLNN